MKIKIFFSFFLLLLMSLQAFACEVDISCKNSGIRVLSNISGDSGAYNCTSTSSSDGSSSCLILDDVYAADVCTPGSSGFQVLLQRIKANNPTLIQSCVGSPR